MAFDTKAGSKADFDLTDEGATAAPETGAAPAKRPSRAKRAIALLALLAGLGYGGKLAHEYWTDGRFFETTDDAYVTADFATLSPEVSGHISAVPVRENQFVRAGDVLFRIEDGDYQIALSQAQNQVAIHDQTLTRITAQIDAARASVAQAEASLHAAEATLRNARSNVERARSLRSSNVTSQAKLDDAETSLEAALAGIEQSHATIAAAEANVAVLQAQHTEQSIAREGLELSVAQAKRNLNRTVLLAPYDGVVANVAVETGDLVGSTSTLAAVVPTDALYVEANFKETQLAHMAPGASVHLKLDMLPDLEFEGHVVSLAPGTGAVFSLLPTDNATGNFTKVVQRVPVRISIPEEALADGRLRAGLSAEVSVDTRTGTLSATEPEPGA
ncbi:HlyD family secretion protein [Tropicimonas sp. TH_r6]|uniref:HlyD family secretion protein n=1 Tax=Tropicimonas sp. TH_r6 TaxID=3082085 RepID=UPI0029541EA3|nr:HlyD family secretion protein [Tropicimonas sp. TH_r6]MDV7143427.1 HlyD family secretion protein [Tropicimonas sp. TH_r6]